MGIPSDTQRPAGWYPDPDGPDQQERWWDGSAWTSSTRGAMRPEVVSPGAGGGGYPMPDSGGWQEPGVGGDGQPEAGFGAPVNRAATAGLTLGGVPFLVVPVASLVGKVFGWVDQSILTFLSYSLYYFFLVVVPFMLFFGLIFSCVGLLNAKRHKRAGFGPVGRLKAITGALLSLLGLALHTFVAWVIYCMSGIGGC